MSPDRIQLHHAPQHRPTDKPSDNVTLIIKPCIHNIQRHFDTDYDHTADDARDERQSQRRVLKIPSSKQTFLESEKKLGYENALVVRTLVV